MITKKEFFALSKEQQKDAIGWAAEESADNFDKYLEWYADSECVKRFKDTCFFEMSNS